MKNYKPLYDPDDFLVIPIELCTYVIRENILNPFRTFIYLKFRFRKGVFQVTPDLINEIQNDLNIKSDKTIHKHLNELGGLKWISYNTRKERIFIRGWLWISIQLGFCSRSAVIFKKNDFISFRTFCAAASIGSYIRWYYKKSRREEAVTSALKKCGKRAIQEVTLPSSYENFPVRAIADYLKISIGKVVNIKKDAVIQKYLKINKRYRRIIDNEGKTITSNYISHFKKTHPELCHKIKKSGNIIVEQCPDEITPLMKYCKRRKKNEPKKCGN